MKTKILSVSLMFVVISGILNSTYAATANNTGYTILNNIKAINKIEIRGNVELFISDNPTEQVKVYNKYYSETALVQSSNGVLRISSYTPEKLIVWVTSENLRSVSAYDNAEVRSFGDVSKIEFSIDLHDYATAKLRFDSYSADVTLNDHSKIEVSGTVTEFHVNRNASSSFIKPDFSAEHYTESKVAKQTETSKDELAGLE
ncbi:MAG: GIN domain-containing protein [Mucilaginibacter sp.]